LSHTSSSFPSLYYQSSCKYFLSLGLESYGRCLHCGPWLEREPAKLGCLNKSGNLASFPQNP
jgi:hypothetical protein